MTHQPRSGRQSTSVPGVETEPTGSGVRFGWYLTWTMVMTGLLLGYIPPTLDLVQRWTSTFRTVLLATCTTVALVVTARVIGFSAVGMGRRGLGAAWRIGVIFLAALPWLASSVHPSRSLVWALIPWTSAVLIAVDLPTRRRWWWLVAALGALAALRALTVFGTGGDLATAFETVHPGEGRVVVAIAVIIPLSIIGQVWMWDIVLRLKREADTRTELARTQERLRFAGDLHDIQGHHLQVIALKTELTGRLIGVDNTRARQQSEEANKIARQALNETRALVRGYRQVSLHDELENSADILSSAGIGCLLDVDDARLLQGELGSLLGTLLREATTNVLRHTQARSVDIVVTVEQEVVSLRVDNDGVTVRSDQQKMAEDGTGLLGLTERFAACGGGIDIRGEDHAFTVRGWLPLQSAEPIQFADSSQSVSR